MIFVHALTKGWLFRVFVMLIVLMCISMKTTGSNDHKIMTGMVIIIAVTALFSYAKIGFHTLVLMHLSYVKVTPNYFSKLKKSLTTLIILSFLPGFLLLPHIQTVAALWSLQVMLVLLVMMAFRYKKIAWSLGGLPILNMVVSQLGFTLPKDLMSYIFYDVMSYCLPLWCLCLYWVINRLEKVNIPAARVINIKRAYGANMLGTRLDINKDHEKDWLKTSLQLDYQLVKSAIQKLNNLRPLPKVQLLAIASGNFLMNFRGAFNCIAFGSVILFGFLQINNLKNSLIILFMFCSGGLLCFAMSAFVIKFRSSKGYLARLRLTPLFESEQKFNRVLLRCYLHQQLMATFVSLSIAIIFLSLNHIMSQDLFLQLVIANALSFTALTSVLLWGVFQANLSLKLIILVQLVVSIFIAICSAARYFENGFLSNETLILISLGIIVTALISLLVWFKKGVNWRVA